jgi:hypothetical protein
MTAREAYFKAYMYSDKPLGMLFYTFKQNNIERIGNTQWLVLDKEDHEYNIGSLEHIEKCIQGFLFWNISDEASVYNKDKSKKHKEVLSVLAFMQK